MLTRIKFDLDDLAEEMLDTLPEELFQNKTTTFLDPAMGGGQFVAAIERRLRKYGHSDNNIANRVFGLELSWRVQIAVNKMKLIGEYEYNYEVADFLEAEMAMKFDVIIGNPPFHDIDNDKMMLWNKFMTKAMEVCKDDGYVAMVTPITWLSSKTNIHNSYETFEDYQVKKAVVYAKNDTPFNIASTISYHITKKTPRVSKTPVYYSEWSKRSMEYVRDIDLKTEKIWPSEFTKLNMQIHDKLMKFEKIEFVKSNEFHNQKLKKKKLVSNERTTGFPHTHHVSAAITRYTSIKYSRHADWKVMVPLTSTINKAVIDNNCGHGEDMLTLYVDNKQTAEIIQHIFQTVPFRFIGKLYKNGRNQPLQKVFPNIPLTKKWTTEEIYDILDLTSEEREYVSNYS